MIQKFLNLYKIPPTSTSKIDEKLINKKYRYWRIRVFYSMFLGYVVYYFTRKNISPVLHIFSQELNISIMELGILSSVFYVTYGIGKFLSGVLADHSNTRFFMATGLFFASVINLFFGFFESLPLLAFFWGLNGVFQSMGFPPVARSLVHWFSPSERATKWTIWSASHTTGTFLVGLIVAFLLKHVGWRSAFYVPGIIGIITSLILINRLRDVPTTLGLPPIEIFKNDPMPIKEKFNLSYLEILKKYILKNYALWALCFAYIFVYLIRFGTLDWATKFMYDTRGIDKVRAAVIWSFMPLLGIPGGIVAGYIADKFFSGRCTPINIIYLVLLAGSIWGFYKFASMEHFYLTCFFISCIGFLVDGPQNLIGGVQVSRIIVPQAVSTACGLSGLFGYIGAIISGVGLAFVTEKFGWGSMYGVCIISCFITIILTLFTWNKEKAHIIPSRNQI